MTDADADADTRITDADSNQNHRLESESPTPTRITDADTRIRITDADTRIRITDADTDAMASSRKVIRGVVKRIHQETGEEEIIVVKKRALTENLTNEAITKRAKNNSIIDGWKWSKILPVIPTTQPPIVKLEVPGSEDTPFIIEEVEESFHLPDPVFNTEPNPVHLPEPIPVSTSTVSTQTDPECSPEPIPVLTATTSTQPDPERSDTPTFTEEEQNDYLKKINELKKEVRDVYERKEYYKRKFDECAMHLEDSKRFTKHLEDQRDRGFISLERAYKITQQLKNVEKAQQSLNFHVSLLRTPLPKNPNDN